MLRDPSQPVSRQADFGPHLDRQAGSGVVVSQTDRGVAGLAGRQAGVGSKPDMQAVLWARTNGLDDTTWVVTASSAARVAHSFRLLVHSLHAPCSQSPCMSPGGHSCQASGSPCTSPTSHTLLTSLLTIALDVSPDCHDRDCHDRGFGASIT